MSKHTPGPWCINYRSATSVEDKVGRLVASTGGRQSNVKDENLENEANAARIIVCVNACAGINPEAVPELLAALYEAEWAIPGDTIGTADSSCPVCGFRRRDGHMESCPIRTAIAKAEGGGA